jgi:hypothetical protein
MFNIKGDLKPITKHLTRLQKKQMPFAAATAINDTLKQVVKAEQMQIVKRLDRPTPFTVKAFKIKWAKKHALHGEVIIKPLQWKYLKYQVEGGTRTGRIGVPTANAKLNKYGNIPGRRKGLIRNKKQYMTDSGVWEKSGGKRNPKAKLIVAFVSSVTYNKRFPFKKIADGVARSQFQKNFKRSIKRAIATAR